MTSQVLTLNDFALCSQRCLTDIPGVFKGKIEMGSRHSQPSFVCTHEVTKLELCLIFIVTNCAQNFGRNVQVCQASTRASQVQTANDRHFFSVKGLRGSGGARGGRGGRAVSGARLRPGRRGVDGLEQGWGQ